jgi:hypothetical protein
MLRTGHIGLELPNASTLIIVLHAGSIVADVEVLGHHNNADESGFFFEKVGWTFYINYNYTNVISHLAPCGTPVGKS